jgi:hypothetical protein
MASFFLTSTILHLPCFYHFILLSLHSFQCSNTSNTPAIQHTTCISHHFFITCVFTNPPIFTHSYDKFGTIQRRLVCALFVIPHESPKTPNLQLSLINKFLPHTNTYPSYGSYLYYITLIYPYYHP